MISVVIPLYNKEKQIANTLHSVLKQTFQNFEVIIVNDGSTDNSVLEVGKVHDARIRVINQENAGVSVARNRGIEEAYYDLIAFLDADNEWKPKYLETQYNLYQKYPECSVYGCNYEFKNITGEIIKANINKLPFDEEDGILTNYFEVASCSHPPICSISIMVKKEAIRSINGFPVGIKSGEDLLTWARLAIKECIAYSRNNLAIYRMSGSTEGLLEKRFDEKDNVTNELLKLYRENPSIIGLNSFVFRWIRINYCICIDMKKKRSARIVIEKALKNHIKLFQSIVLWSLSLLPSSLLKYLYYKYHNR